MELRVLRYFLAVVREQSVSKAADALHVTQPTLSRQIMDLEEELGARLFERTHRGKGFTLTDAGTRFFNRAEEIVELADMTAAEFRSANECDGGDIYIGAGESTVMRLVTEAAVSIRAGRPKFCFHIFSGNSLVLLERLDRGLLDFAVVLDSVNVEKYESIPLPHADRVGVLIRKDSPLAQKERVSLSDLAGVPLLVSQQQGGVSAANMALANEGGASLTVAGTYNLLYNASVMVAGGFGAALCLELNTNRSEQSPLTFRPLDPPIETRWNMAWRRNAGLSRAAGVFLERMRGLTGAV